MNSLVKTILAALGAINAVFSILIPMGFALLLVTVYGYNGLWTGFLVVAGIISSLFRAIKIGFIK